jgi:inner membrane transporter RhtA
MTLPPVLSILLAVLTVQSGASIAKGLFPVLGAAATASVRNGLSAILLLAVFRPPLLGLTANQWRAVVPYGVTIGVMNLLFYQTIARIPLGLGVTLEFIGPLGVAIVGSRRVLDVLWVVLAALGIALIAPWQTKNAIDPVGVALGLLTGVCWATYIVLGGRVSQRLPGGSAVAIGMSLATLTVLPFALAGGGLARFSPRLFLSGAALALLSSALPFTLEMHALRALPGRTFSILMSLEPAVAALCGLLFLNERLTEAQSVAVGLVIAASIGAAVTTTRVPVHVEV